MEVQLKGFGISNFKAIKEFFEFEFAPITLLIGPNGSGKSTLFKAMKYSFQQWLKKNNYGTDRSLSALIGAINDRSEYGMEGNYNVEIKSSIVKIKLADFEFTFQGFSKVKCMSLELSYEANQLKFLKFYIDDLEVLMCNFDFEENDQKLVFEKANDSKNNYHNKTKYHFNFNNICKAHTSSFANINPVYDKKPLLPYAFLEKSSLLRVYLKDKFNNETNLNDFIALCSSLKKRFENKDSMSTLAKAEMEWLSKISFSSDFVEQFATELGEEIDFDKNFDFYKVFNEFKNFPITGLVTKEAGIINDYSKLNDIWGEKYKPYNDILKRFFRDPDLFKHDGDASAEDKLLYYEFLNMKENYDSFYFQASRFEHVFCDTINSFRLFLIYCSFINKDLIFIPTIRNSVVQTYLFSSQTFFTETMRKIFEEDWKLKGLLKNIAKYLKDFEIGDELIFEKLPENLGFNLFIKKNERTLKLFEEGFGVSQLVPLILQVEAGRLSSTSGNPPGGSEEYFPPTIIILEEPEINLHPALQSKLADYFADYSIKYNVQFIIETHSEYLVRKLQYIIAKKDFKCDDATIYYFSTDNAVNEMNEKIRKISFKEDGTLSSEFGPGFFDESVNLMMALLKKESQN